MLVADVPRKLQKHLTGCSLAPLSWRNSVLIHWTRVGQVEPALPLRVWSFDKYDGQYTTGHAGGCGNSGVVEDGRRALQFHPVKSAASGWLKQQAVDLVLFRME